MVQLQTSFLPSLMTRAQKIMNRNRLQAFLTGYCLNSLNITYIFLIVKVITIVRHKMQKRIKLVFESESDSRSVVSASLRPHGLNSPWNSPGQNTGVGSLSLLQGIFPTQGLNPGLPHCGCILYQLSHKGSPFLNHL